MNCMPRCAPPVPHGLVPVLLVMPQPVHSHPRHLEVDTTTTSRVGVTGGDTPARFTLEYYVDAGTESASVTLTLLSNGQTTTWSDSNVAAGYHVQQQLSPMPPGTKVTLQASNALARLRWCETFCC